MAYFCFPTSFVCGLQCDVSEHYCRSYIFKWKMTFMICVILPLFFFFCPAASSLIWGNVIVKVSASALTVKVQMLLGGANWLTVLVLLVAGCMCLPWVDISRTPTLSSMFPKIPH